MDVTHIRTLLFTPANRPERFLKAKTIGADGIIIDLEDAIALAEKDQARNIIVDYFKQYQADEKFAVCLRINSIRTVAGLKDITAILDHQLKPDFLMLPKVEQATEITLLDALCQVNPLSYLAIIETAKGVINAPAIANCSQHLKGICFGGADLAADIGASLTWENMYAARSQLVLAAASAGIAVLDVPYLNFQETDDKALREEIIRSKALGFTGKLAIHPKHVSTILNTFAPTAEEVTWAKRIVAAYENANGNVCELDGKMIDVPVVRAAQRILALSNR